MKEESNEDNKFVGCPVTFTLRRSHCDYSSKLSGVPKFELANQKNYLLSKCTVISSLQLPVRPG